jgi:hypothetical protein
MMGFAMAAALGGSIASAFAEDLVVRENNRTIAQACDGKTTAEIDGNDNTITLTGECVAVKVMGNRNTVAFEAAATLSTWGNDNVVSYQRGPGKKPAPAISNPGSRNRISRIKN